MRALLCALMLVFSLSVQAGISDVRCMAAAIWAESRGEPHLGQVAVGHVILNRMNADGKTACQVVKQKGQFSWTKDPSEKNRAFVKSGSFMDMATEILNGEYEDPTNGATYFHLSSMRPKWTYKLERTKKIKNHIFWKERD